MWTVWSNPILQTNPALSPGKLRKGPVDGTGHITTFPENPHNLYVNKSSVIICLEKKTVSELFWLPPL